MTLRCFALLLGLLSMLFMDLHCPVLAQNTPTPPASLSAQVDAAMASARVSDFNLCFPLFRRGEEVLPLLEKYTDDPNHQVRQAIYFFAEQSHSPEAVKILSLLIAQMNGQAIDHIYMAYTPDEIDHWGGPPLKQNLLKYLQNTQIGAGPSSIRAIFLLAAFPPDPEVRLFLSDIRAHGLFYTEDDYFQGRTIKRQIEKHAQMLYYTSNVKLALPVDLVLSEEGDKEATQRVIQNIRSGDVNNTIVFILAVTRFIRQKPVLLELVELVRDKRFTHLSYRVVVETDSAGSKLAPVPVAAPEDDSLRVCDLAVAALVESTEIDVGIPDLMAAIKSKPQAFPSRRFTDGELRRAYSVLNDDLTSNAP